MELLSSELNATTLLFLECLTKHGILLVVRIVKVFRDGLDGFLATFKSVHGAFLESRREERLEVGRSVAQDRLVAPDLEVLLAFLAGEDETDVVGRLRRE